MHSACLSLFACVCEALLHPVVGLIHLQQDADSLLKLVGLFAA